MTALAQLPLTLSTTWRSKRFTTDPPRLTPHEEWALVLGLVAEVPFRLVTLRYFADRWEWALSSASAATQAELTLQVFPPDEDPRAQVAAMLPDSVTTGRPASVYQPVGGDHTVAILAVAEQDVQRRRHGRWRVLPSRAADLPDDLAALADGRQSGGCWRQATPPAEHGSDGGGRS